VGPLAILEASESVETDSEGRFEFPELASQESGVVWATAAGFTAGWTASSANQQKALVLSLKGTEGQVVRVSRSSGATVQGAVVVQQGTCGGQLRSGGLSDEDVAMLLYARSARVGGDGVAVLPAWSGRRLYMAQLEGLRSGVEASDGSGEPVELALEESIQLAGSVTVEGGGASLAGALMYCFLYDVETGRQRYLQAVPLPADGHVQGVRLPWSPEEGYRLVVEGEGLARAEEWFAPVPAGGTLGFNLVCKAGGVAILHFFEALESSDSVANVAGVTATPIWYSASQGGYGSPFQSVLSDSDGLARLTNFPVGTISFRYSAPGYVMDFTPEFTPSELSSEPIEVELHRSGRVRVKVTDGGETVDRFRILYWGEGMRASDATTVSRTADPDGYAFLDGLPLGNLQLLASVEGRPQTMPTSVDVVSTEDRNIELQVAEAVVGHGRVLDSGTGLPVPEALIQISLTAAGDSPGYLNSGLPVEPDGSFSFALFAPSITMITIRAEGYSSLPAMGDLGEDGQIDFGTLHVARTQALTIQCLSSGEVDWTQYYGNVRGLIWSEDAPLNPDGTYVASDGQHGPSAFTLFGPDGGQISRSWTLRGTGPWYREVRLGGDASLDVSLDGEPDWTPSALELSFSTDLDHGDSVRIPVEPGSSSLRFASLEAGSYSLTCFDSMGWPRVCTSVEVHAGQEEAVTLGLELTSFRVRLLSEDGIPIAGAYVWARDAGHLPNVVGTTVSTNDEGIALLTSTDISELIVEAISATGGYSGPHTVVPPKTEDPVDVVWAEGDLLEIEVFDGPVPLEGLEVWVHRAETSYATVTLDVPEDGHYQRPNIATGEYFAEPHSSWVWFQRSFFDFDGSPARLEFRRLGDLTVHVKDLLGNPVGGVAVSLTSDEFGESVGDWLATGRVSSDTGLVTDAQGVVRISGLPHGAYSWSVGAQIGGVDVAVGSGSLLGVQLGE